MKLVYIVDWLPPDYGAIGQYALKEARERAEQGDEVHLWGLSSRQSSEEVELLGAGRLVIHRLLSGAVPRSNLRERARWTLGTNARLVASALPQMRSADEILFTASPPFLEHLIIPLRRLLKGQVIFRIADVHPEVLMNEVGRVPAWLRAFHALTLRRRREVSVLEVLGEDQRELMIANGVAPERVRLRRSGSPISWDSQCGKLARPPALDGLAILLYSGAVGHAHEIDTFVAGYALHHQRGLGGVGLWLNAEGTFADRFEQEVRSRGLPIHRSKTVPLAELCSLLNTADAHLITLKDAYVGLVVPSKMYACLASGKDILYVGSPRSDVDLLCRRQRPDGYFQAAVGNSDGVAAALNALSRRVSEGS